ncbi:MAG: hypothetical protein COU85_02055 [Candidatus Portnoybacteria bacterium CG10_big_fil_rev_8_21_14_0_10_44_7]|uniref:Uncharacterized protein n=1 Tax=Candidatus Portnoybacteria bacterium CG10_big_fil_rev_8_21_14_0_10_44_7 TaxID=1974816 RepID=A0A2M8KII0_9BACT|nr:MAG: hypothetical protein COU85_02055 [Candidatus Portnoybacteria bacterium CG10_big_fil_rev_8_21_14_0_10_44_7]
MELVLSIIAISISIIAIIVSAKGWHKSRAIYDIEKFKFPKRVGNSKTDEDKRLESALRNKLKTGQWQILHIYENVNPRSNEVLGLIVIIGKNTK